MKKILALLLALSLLLCGCGGGDRIGDNLGEIVDKPGVTAKPETDEIERSVSVGAPAEDGYFEFVWRANADYNYMDFEVYNLGDFDALTQPMYDLAENGGSAEDFEEIDYDMVEELYYIYTMAQLADLEWCKNPADEALADKLAKAEETFRKAYDEYAKAMSALANSQYANLIQYVYHESYISYFASYDPELSAQHNESAGVEGDLISEYYALMSEDVVDGNAVADVFIQLVELRNAAVEIYGYESYADYAYENLYYRDYTPQDVAALYEGIKTHFAPLMYSYEEAVWDASDRLMASDIRTSPKSIIEAIAAVLPKISPELDEAWQYMRDYHLYDISTSPEKAQLGFTTTLYYVNQPFIFNAAGGAYYDYMDTIHEFGHFASAYANSSDLLFGMADMDLCELQSQGMEMLFTPFYGEIFGEHAEDAQAYTLMSMLYSVVDGAMYDEFQQRVYAEENLSLEGINSIFTELYAAYGHEPYPGCETLWMEVVHNFEQPFYYISYTMSALAALEIYNMLYTDWDAALDTYMTVCAMNPEYYYFSEALDEAGLENIFDPAGYGDIAASVENALK